MSLFLITAHDDRNGFDQESSILTLARSVDRVANEFDLTKMAHMADLQWIVGELKGVLVHWGETEILNAVTKERVQHLVTALTDKIKEA